MKYKFVWGPAKERKNVQKHGVTFYQAASVFRDPNQISIYDEEHSEQEERWITLGLDRSGVLRVGVRTFREVGEDLYEIRIISARKATKREAKQYREWNR